MTEPARTGRRTAAAVLTSLVAAGGGAAGVAWAAATPPPSTAADGAGADAAAPAAGADARDLRRLTELRHRLEAVRRDLPHLLAGIQRLPTAAGIPVGGDVSVPPYVPPSAPRLPSPPRAAAPAPAPAPPPATHTSTGASGG